MKELVFIETNKKRWNELERMLHSGTYLPPDRISELFIQITDDLAYTRTYYPQSRIIPYLNSLAVEIHHRIYRNKKLKRNRLGTFWFIDYPLLVHKERRYILYALLVFLTAVAIGLLSTAHDPAFTRLILGDRYVNMTMNFIHKGDPMAVYKQMNPSVMFLGITINNLFVAFRCVVFGIFLSMGTAFELLKNGIMVGAFQEFFAQQHLLKESILSIYIHGTFELFSIVISGAAGFMIGSGIMFPGNYRRIDSFITGVQNAMQLLIGVIPLFVVAAFLEGFITRLTSLPDLIRAGIIGSALLFIVFYFFIYPNLIYKKLLPDGK